VVPPQPGCTQTNKADDQPKVPPRCCLGGFHADTRLEQCRFYFAGRRSAAKPLCNADAGDDASAALHRPR
jgi:hypothetical protein